jgi:membrane-associated phospholipid phosphatase
MFLKGLRTKQPHTLAWQGFLAGAFMVAVVSGGHWLSSLEAGVGIGIVCFLIGLGYRLATDPRAAGRTSGRQIVRGHSGTLAQARLPPSDKGW